MSRGSSTVTIRPDSDLQAGETFYVNFATYADSDVLGGKKGGLKKRGPFDGVVFDSYAGVRLRGNADGMESPIPADTARTLDANDPGAFVSVTNPSTSGTTVAKEDIEIILFGKADAGREANRLQFSGTAVVSDLVPGVVTRD